MIWGALVFTAKVAGALLLIGAASVAAVMSLLLMFHFEQSRKSVVQATVRRTPGLTPMSESLARDERAKRWYDEQEVRAAEDELALAGQEASDENVGALLAKWRSAAQRSA